MAQDPMQLVEKVPEAKGKKETPDYAKLIFTSKMLTGSFDIAYHRVKSDSLLELEGKVIKIGPHGGKVEAKMPKHYYESGKEITADQVTELVEYENGDREPAQDLPQSEVWDIVEERPEADCNFDGTDLSTTHGTTIRREDVAKYAPDSEPYETWEARPAGYLKLAQYLEGRNEAILFPFSHGGGRKVHTMVMYPVRLEQKLFMGMYPCAGQVIWRHPIEAAGEVTETQKVALPPIRIRNRQKTLAGVS